MSYGIYGIGGDYWDTVTRAAGKEMLQATLGRGLPSLKALTPPQEALDAPPDNGGARLVSAYWLTVGARLALEKGNNAAADSLIAASRAYLLMATGATAPFIDPFRVFLGQGGSGSRESTIRKAADKADAAGQSDVARILRGMTNEEALAASQAKYGGQRTVPTLCANVGLPPVVCDPWEQGRFAPVVAIILGLASGVFMLRLRQKKGKKKTRSAARRF